MRNERSKTTEGHFAVVMGVQRFWRGSKYIKVVGPGELFRGRGGGGGVLFRDRLLGRAREKINNY